MESLTFTFVIVIIILVALAGYTVWDASSKQRLQRDVLARWSKNRTIHHAPIIAQNYGYHPRDSYVGVYPSAGVIGVADDRVIFVRRGGDDHESFIRLDNLRWIGSRRIRIKQGKYTVEKTALILHHEASRQWFVSAFLLDSEARIGPLLNVLAAQSGLEVRPYVGRREDFGPHAAQRMAQDVYGQWQTATSDGSAHGATLGTAISALPGLSGELYLAPDRLVYNGYTAILFAQIRQANLYEQGGLQKLNPFNEELLRIEYEQDGQHQVAGFLVRNGRQWAAALEAHLNIPVEIHEGRKKK